MGWLDNAHAYTRGNVDDALIEKMRQLASKPVELYRGFHVCQLCIEPPNLVKEYVTNRAVLDPECSWARWLDGRKSNGEIRVSLAGTTFAAPVLIVHYIEAHRYLPPEEFLRAVKEAP